MSSAEAYSVLFRVFSVRSRVYSVLSVNGEV